jgi:hypothetical protein
VQKQKFTAKGLNTQDLVTLVGKWSYNISNSFNTLELHIEVVITLITLVSTYLF